MPGMLGMIQGAHASTQIPIHRYGHPYTKHIKYTCFILHFAKTQGFPGKLFLDYHITYHTCYLSTLCACSNPGAASIPNGVLLNRHKHTCTHCSCSLAKKTATVLIRMQLLHSHIVYVCVFFFMSLCLPCGCF